MERALQTDTTVNILKAKDREKVLKAAKEKKKNPHY